jgi:ferritin-like metal-binding protein YciE
MAAQKVEHYEIATYGGLVTLAQTMGNEEVADILAVTLEEEKQTDLDLTGLAENNINWEAEQEDEEDEQEADDEA